DDMVITEADGAGSRRRTYVAARRTAAMRPSDRRFVALVDAMLRTIATDADAFDRGEARIVLATRPDSPGARDWAVLRLKALDSNSGADLAGAINFPRAFSSRVRTRFKSLRTAVALAVNVDPESSEAFDAIRLLLRAVEVRLARLEADDAEDRRRTCERL